MESQSAGTPNPQPPVASTDLFLDTHFHEYWDKYKFLARGSREQIGALERLQLIFSELLQCEKSYEL
jgi:hypothetical protein